MTLGALIVLWLIMRLFTRGQFSFGRLVEGTDGRYSTSKFQAALWALALIAGYVAIYVARSLKGEVQFTIEVPANLLLLSAASAGTFVGAKVITEAGLQSGRVSKPPAADAKAGDLVNDDSGNTELGKFQLVAWTLIAVSIFLFTIHQSLVAYFAPDSSFLLRSIPDVDTTLLALMGISQATYLFKKATTEEPSPATPLAETAPALPAPAPSQPATPLPPTVPAEPAAALSPKGWKKGSS
jgi:hypothetical protein